MMFIVIDTVNRNASLAEALIALTPIYREALEIAIVHPKSDVVELSDRAERKLMAALAVETELNETLKTGLSRSARGVRAA